MVLVSALLEPPPKPATKRPPISAAPDHMLLMPDAAGVVLDATPQSMFFMPLLAPAASLVLRAPSVEAACAKSTSGACAVGDHATLVVSSSAATSASNGSWSCVFSGRSVTLVKRSSGAIFAARSRCAAGTLASTGLMPLTTCLMG